MDKTVTVNGVQYMARRCRNVDNANILYYKRRIALVLDVMADSIHMDKEPTAATLLDFAYVSGLVTGGTALLTRIDTDEQFFRKCINWLISEDLVDLADVLVAAVNEANPKNPDRALAPEPLPEDADPKVSSAAKSSKKRRSRIGSRSTT